MSARNCSRSSARQRDRLAERRILAGGSAAASTRLMPLGDVWGRIFEGFFMSIL